MRFARSRTRDEAVRAAVTVKVITYAPTVFSHCQHCEIAFGEVGIGERIRRDEAASALPDDLAADFARLSDWIRRIVDRHGARIHVEVIDAASVEGMLASLRHRVWRYPAVVVGTGPAIVGSKYEVAEPLIDRQLSGAARQAEGPNPRVDPSIGAAGDAGPTANVSGKA
jgi:hypothetical protein